MESVALEKVFEIIYPEIRAVVVGHLYRTPGKTNEIKVICEKPKVIIIEDTAESLVATYQSIQTGTFEPYNRISLIVEKNIIDNLCKKTA